MMQKMNLRVLLLCGLGVTLAGCGWTDKEAWRSAVWADDDSVVSAVRVSYEAKPNVWALGGIDYERNHTSRFYLVNPDTGGRTAVGVAESGEIVTQYLMKQEGYLLYRVRPERFSHTETGVGIFKQLDLDTGVSREVARVTDVGGVTCNGTSYSSGIPELSLIPSPSGQIIARVDALHECEQVRVSLSFLDAETLEVIKNVGVVYEDEGEEATWAILDTAWNVWGQFMIKVADEDVVGHSPEDEDRVWGDVGFDCFYPATSSSESNFNGDYVSYTGGQLSTSPDGSMFGCDALEP